MTLSGSAGDLGITWCRCFADYAMPDLDEDVVCLFLPCGSVEGFVLGSFFTGELEPPASRQDIRMVMFKDGTTIAYDRDAHTYEIEIKITHIHADRGQVTLTPPMPSSSKPRTQLSTHLEAQASRRVGTCRSRLAGR